MCGKVPICINEVSLHYEVVNLWTSWPAVPAVLAWEGAVSTAGVGFTGRTAHTAWWFINGICERWFSRIWNMAPAREL